MGHPLHEFEQFMNAIVDFSQPLARRYFRSDSHDIELKDDASPVTQADMEIEELLRRYIMQTYPHHGISGEEHEAHQPDADYQWIIDPIDGTRAFTCGVPCFTTLVGLRYKEQLLCGMINQPVSRERWFGAAGGRATLNEREVYTSKCLSISEARFATTSPYLFDDTQREAIDRIHHHSCIQTYGGDAYNYGLLAAGLIDLILEAGLKPHDIIPIIPIIESAGGFITDWDGNPIDINAPSLNVVVSATEPLHHDALRMIAA